MAKKPNQPFRRYISVPNNKELYIVGKMLTGNADFKLLPEKTEAIAQAKSPNEIMVSISGLNQLSAYEIEANPSILLQTTDKNTVMKKVLERIQNLDELTRDIYNNCLFHHWLHYRDSNDIAYIEIEQMHIDYRGLRGKNVNSSIQPEDYDNYIKAIDILRNTSVKIDFTKENNLVYDKLEKMNVGAVEGYLLTVDRLTYYKNDSTRIKGFYYKLQVILDTFASLIINDNFPTALNQLSIKSKTVRAIGNYLCFLHREIQDTHDVFSDISFYQLMGEARYEISGSRYQQYINRFVENIKKTEEILRHENIVSQIIIPDNIDAKTYKYKKVRVFWTHPPLQIENV
jgi:hypothetical protein